MLMGQRCSRPHVVVVAAQMTAHVGHWCVTTNVVRR